MFIKEVCDGNKKHAKERMKLHYSNKKMVSGSSDSVHNDYESDSEESLLDEIYDLENEIQIQSESLQIARKNLSVKEKNM